MSEDSVFFPSGERPTTRIRSSRAVMLALLLNLLIFGFLYLLSGSFIRDIFMGRVEIDSSRLFFQFLTMYMFCLSIVTVAMKRIKLVKEFRALENLPVPEDLDMKDRSRLLATCHALAAMPDWHQRIVCTRVMRVLVMWINSRDPERTIHYTKENSDLDYTASDASFRANRLYIWSLPLLGFLGTVYGVSYGIGGFADFLRGGEVSTEDITQQVGMITQGLAVAFYTTLVGLFTAGVSAFPSMAAERQEEALLSTLDELIEERVTARISSANQFDLPVASIESIRASLAHIAGSLDAPVRELASAVEQAFKRMPDPAVYQSVFANAIAAAGDLLQQQYATFQAGYEQRMRELASGFDDALRRSSDGFLTAASDVAGRLDAHAALIAGASEQLGKAQRESLQELAENIRAVSADYTLASAKAVEGSREVMRKAGEQLERVIDLGTQIDALLKTSRSVQVALEGVADSEEFRQLIGRLGEHLKASDDMIRQLSRPRQIVLTESY